METKKNQEGLTGIPSGFTNLDRLTSGWQPTELIILAARPAMGKTAFVVSALRNAAVDHGKPVAIFSNYLSIKAELDKIPPRKNVTVDLSQARLVDHTVMERLHDYETDYMRVDGQFHVVGLHNHKRNSGHPMCTHTLPRKAQD